MSDFFNLTDIRFFNVYDKNTQELIYCKLNFNFDLYEKDFKLENKSKLEVFDDFLIRNDTAFWLEPDYLNKGDKTPSYLKPTTVKSELVKYFTPITNEMINYNKAYGFSVHVGYMNVQDPDTYKSATELVKEQFDVIFYKDDQIRRLQDYYYSEKDAMYTKYNFNFDLFSNDYNVYGNKLVIFTDFISRVIYSSGTFPGVYGNGNPRGFKKYFIQNNNLLDYLNKYSVTSIYKNVAQKNEHNIDYLDYAMKANLPSDISERNAREHYIRYGQFTQTKINFVYPELTDAEKNKNSIATIYADGTGAGFLYSNNSSKKDEIYCVTAAHNLSKGNLNTFMVSLSITDGTRNNVSTKAQFRVLGRDVYTDLLVGIFDPELPYNKTFNIDLSNYSPLRVDLTASYTIGETIYAIGTSTSVDNDALLEGVISDAHYSGDFGIQASFIPESLLLDLRAVKGISGAPIFKKNGNTRQVVGLAVGMYGKYTIALSAFMLDNLVTNIIARAAGFRIIYKDNPTLYTISTKRALVKRWLGATTSYYHKITSSQYNPYLSTLPINSGLVLHDFILGFDYVNRQYVFDADSLTREGVTKLDGPLLTSNMYNRFIDSGKTPIVLKSAAFTQGWIGQFAKYEFGKFSNQDAFYNFTYGWSAIGSKPVPKGVADNGLVAIMGRIYFEYYWFNGERWIYEKEELNDDYDEKWFTVYTDSLGNRFYDSKWSFPSILYSYDMPYVLSLGVTKGSGVKQPLGIVTDNPSANSGMTGTWGGSGIPGSWGSGGIAGSWGSGGIPGSWGSGGIPGSWGSGGIPGSWGSDGILGVTPQLL